MSCHLAWLFMLSGPLPHCIIKSSLQFPLDQVTHWFKYADNCIISRLKSWPRSRYSALCGFLTQQILIVTNYETLTDHCLHFSTQHDRTGAIMLDGSFGGGSVAASGTGNVYLVGSVSGLMQVDASGISSIFIESTPCEPAFPCRSGLPIAVCCDKYANYGVHTCSWVCSSLSELWPVYWQSYFVA